MKGYEMFLGELINCTTTHNVYPVNTNPNKGKLNILETAAQIGFPEAIMLSNMTTRQSSGNEIAKLLYAKVTGCHFDKENIHPAFFALIDCWYSMNKSFVSMTIKEFFNCCVNVLGHEKKILHQECPNKQDIITNLRTEFDKIVNEVLNRDYQVFEKEDGKKK